MLSGSSWRKSEIACACIHASSSTRPSMRIEDNGALRRSACSSLPALSAAAGSPAAIVDNDWAAARQAPPARRIHARVAAVQEDARIRGHPLLVLDADYVEMAESRSRICAT